MWLVSIFLIGAVLAYYQFVRYVKASYSNIERDIRTNTINEKSTGKCGSPTAGEIRRANIENKYSRHEAFLAIYFAWLYTLALFALLGYCLSYADSLVILMTARPVATVAKLSKIFMKHLTPSTMFKEFLRSISLHHLITVFGMLVGTGLTASKRMDIEIVFFSVVYWLSIVMSCYFIWKSTRHIV